MSACWFEQPWWARDEQWPVKAEGREQLFWSHRAAASEHMLPFEHVRPCSIKASSGFLHIDPGGSGLLIHYSIRCELCKRASDGLTLSAAETQSAPQRQMRWKGKWAKHCTPIPQACFWALERGFRHPDHTRSPCSWCSSLSLVGPSV